MNKNGEYSHLKRTMLTVFHVRFVFVLFETLGFCKSVRVVFPDLDADPFGKVYKINPFICVVVHYLLFKVHKDTGYLLKNNASSGLIYREKAY